MVSVIERWMLSMPYYYQSHCKKSMHFCNAIDNNGDVALFWLVGIWIFISTDPSFQGNLAASQYASAIVVLLSCCAKRYPSCNLSPLPLGSREHWRHIAGEVHPRQFAQKKGAGFIFDVYSYPRRKALRSRATIKSLTSTPFQAIHPE
jgi:hypothetical protein